MSHEAPLDAENPELTRKDIEKARPASELPPDVRMAVPRMRGAQKAAKKIPVSIRLSAEVVARFKAGGRGWQARIDEALKRTLGL